MSVFILLLSALLLYARFVEPRRLQLRQVRLQLPHLPDAFAGLRIAHVSDLHLGGWLQPDRLGAWLARINDLQPELVVISGDFVDETADRPLDDLFAPLRTLQAPTLAVLGNHDHRRGVAQVRQALTASGVHVLRNEVHTLQREGAQLQLAGLGDQAWRDDDLDALLDQLPAQGCAILLAHEPDIADVACASERFALQLSGHTHGGQMRLPLLRRAHVLPSWGQHFDAGLFQADGLLVYVNRGLGMIRPWLRFNCRPEITLLELQPGPPAT